MPNPTLTPHSSPDASFDPDHTRRWQFWVDRGGTFTDIVALRPDGGFVTHKLLSENPSRYPDAVIQGIRDLLGIAQDAPLPHEQIEVVKMGTTVATNALLERKGARTVLAITRGFGDQLRIGYQDRPDIFARHIALHDQLYERVVEISERVDAQGNVLQALDEGATRAALTDAYTAGIRAVAIVLMHGYRHGGHERRVAKIAREIGFTQVSVSHETSPLMKIVGRADTTLMDAYLSPILRDYVSRVTRHTGPTPLMFMQSSGGLASAQRFQGKDAILSGPAGGVVGAVKTCANVGEHRVIGFDMGGTSTDVMHYDGEYERVFETQVAGVRVRAPMMHVHTVAAGGGSICTFENGRFKVGPESAGANPGPACYRNGGPLTVTDCNVMLGRIQPEHFPHVFGPEGNQPIDVDVVRERFAVLAQDVAAQSGVSMTPEAVAEGFLSVAVDSMARAIKMISVERGYDVSDYAMCSFGGAGGQHACRVADVLGIGRVVIHPFAGVLSALGMGLSDLRALREFAVEEVLDDRAVAALQGAWARVADEAGGELAAQQVPASAVTYVERARIKYKDTDTPIEVDRAAAADMALAFEQAHRQRFGFAMEGKPLVIESIAVEAIGVMDVADTREGALAAAGHQGKSSSAIGNAPANETVTLYVSADDDGTQVATQAGWGDVPLRRRRALAAGDRVEGPALISEDISTIVVEPGWTATVLDDGTLRLARTGERSRHGGITTERHPVHLEIFNNLFMSIAQQMGTTLEKTSRSVNMKERLDFSCALFDAEGNLIANAPHIPVHLGSMSDSVRAVIDGHRQHMAPGDVYMLNVPYNGGTHLPDITVVMPVFDRADGGLLFYVAARGHHGDVGGITPGSMPSASVSIEQEGVLLDNVRIARNGVFLEAAVRELFASGPYPARNIDQNIADLIAQVAACETGVNELMRAIHHYGRDVVMAYMGHVQDNAEEAVRRAAQRLKEGEYACEMDDGAVIRVRVSIDRERGQVKVDFTGTSAQRPTNFNAPRSICKAAVLYVFRTLIDEAIPMNEGVLRPIDIVIPTGSMLSPVYPAAVVAGNVEVSQAATDALYGALGVLAASQGTMNNFTFGDAQRQYYETIAGGSGAGPDHHGTSAVQTHMTNSRMTDPEVLETRFPVLVETHAIRYGSGGDGKWRGGDGAIRKIRFREPMTASILAGRRRVRPFGLAGGSDAAAGCNWIERADGAVEHFGATHTATLNAGDAFVIETPGGGGYGKA
ncbi:hydantoinase B/oxoprolinase family protein [Cupriavidus plantarum]|uniref:hydantoinase B/oxoprolinase family protein n=1 Tax=Cupriavidus plantarum TaxID=942865 RepID=UPI000E242A2F|nr:hydantoinase B/oxoprolinase family protein [Cupriavidus plantarum]REE85258.1 5-oxoprolinase (ATP-hydrolysing) [Cupriavidus plantarum]